MKGLLASAFCGLDDKERASKLLILYLSIAFIFVILKFARYLFGSIGTYLATNLYHHPIFLTRISDQDAYIFYLNLVVLLSSILLCLIPFFDKIWIKDAPSPSRPVLVSGCFLSVIIYNWIALYYFYNSHSGRIEINAYHGTFWLDCALSISAAVAAPVAEEVFFRGWLWVRTEGLAGSFHAALLTAAAWLSFHLPEFIHTLRLIPLAFALTLLRFNVKSVRTCAILHVINNLFGVIYFALLVYPHHSKIS